MDILRFTIEVADLPADMIERAGLLAKVGEPLGVFRGTLKEALGKETAIKYEIVTDKPAHTGAKRGRKPKATAHHLAAHSA